MPEGIDDGFQAGPVKTDFAQDQLSGTIQAQHTDAAKQSADTLRNGGCQCGRAYTQVQNSDEHQVQDNIDDTGENQIVQRVTAIAHGMKNTHKDIVHDREERAAEIKSEIADGVGQNILRRSHPPQNHRGKDHTQNRQQYACAQAKGCMALSKAL